MIKAYFSNAIGHKQIGSILPVYVAVMSRPDGTQMSSGTCYYLSTFWSARQLEIIRYITPVLTETLRHYRVADREPQISGDLIDGTIITVPSRSQFFL